MTAPREQPATNIRRPDAGVSIDVDKLKRLRLERAWSRSELARRAGVTPDTVAKWERGHRRPKPDALGQLAAALDVEPAELLPEQKK